MDIDTFKLALQQIERAHWDINFSEFCRRADFREDHYAVGKWGEWRKLAVGLNAFDLDTLARICGVTGPVCDCTSFAGSHGADCQLALSRNSAEFRRGDEKFKRVRS